MCSKNRGTQCVQAAPKRTMHGCEIVFFEPCFPAPTGPSGHPDRLVPLVLFGEVSGEVRRTFLDSLGMLLGELLQPT